LAPSNFRRPFVVPQETRANSRWVRDSQITSIELLIIAILGADREGMSHACGARQPRRPSYPESLVSG